MVGAALSRTAAGDERKSDWGTPPWFFVEVQRRGGYVFDLDVMATHDNAMCEPYIDEGLDAFLTPWTCEHAWCNPPDVLHLEAVKRCIHQAKIGAFETCDMLVRCGLETAAWQLASAYAHTEIITPRLNYIDRDLGGVVKGIGKHSTLFTFTQESVHEPIRSESRVIHFGEYREPR